MFDLVRQAIETEFDTKWTALANGIALAFGNEQFTGGLDWARISVMFAQSHQASIGDPALEKYPGLVSVQIFTAKGRGSARGLVLADSAAGILRRKALTLSGVTIYFGVPYLETVGERTDYQQTNLVAPFEAQAVLAAAT